MFGLDTILTILLIFWLLLARFFEFINGFHDNDNAVATVINSHPTKPTVASACSGSLNFSGVLLGVIAVSMGTVNLLLSEVLIDVNNYHGAPLILASLLSAIIWNSWTRYFRIPFQVHVHSWLSFNTADISDNVFTYRLTSNLSTKKRFIITNFTQQ